MHDEKFFEAATEGTYISVDLVKKSLDVGDKQFRFELSQMERELHDHGGISSAYHVFEKSLFRAMTRSKPSGSNLKENLLLGPRPELQWERSQAGMCNCENKFTVR